MHSVYVLRSEQDGSLYTGYSHELKQRLIEHQKGKAASTRTKRPIELIYAELYKNRKDAMQREKYFKTGWGRNYIRKILHNTLREK
jgi:putative endonuclease